MGSVAGLVIVNATRCHQTGVIEHRAMNEERTVRKISTLTITAMALLLLAGCTVAEAASVATPRSASPTVEASPTPTPTPTPTPEPEPVETTPAPPPASWENVNGTWCSVAGDCFTVTDYVYEDPAYGTTYWLEQYDAPEGCFRGEAISQEYPGSQVLYCPAGVPTPSVIAGVTNDDATQERIWFYQGQGADTYFKQG